MQEQRCTGACCRNFMFGGGVTPERLAGYVDMPAGTDEHFWAHNAIPRFHYVIRSPTGYRQVVWLYTCKKFDSDTGSCTDYENRPRTCRVYPNHHACEFEGCTYSGFQAVPRKNLRGVGQLSIGGGAVRDVLSSAKRTICDDKGAWHVISERVSVPNL